MFSHFIKDWWHAAVLKLKWTTASMIMLWQLRAGSLHKHTGQHMHLESHTISGRFEASWHPFTNPRFCRATSPLQYISRLPSSTIRFTTFITSFSFFTMLPPTYIHLNTILSRIKPLLNVTKTYKKVDC